MAPALARWAGALRFLRGLSCAAQGGGPCVRMSSGASLKGCPEHCGLPTASRASPGPSDRCESGRRRACGGFILHGAGRRPSPTNVLRRRPLAATSPFTSYARTSALRSESIGASLKACCEHCGLPTASRASPGPSDRCESGRRRACGGFILHGAGRRPSPTNVLRRRPLAATSPFTSYARTSALRSESIGASLKACCEHCGLPTASRASPGWAGVWAK